MAQKESQQEGNAWEAFKEELQTQLEQIQRQLKEIGLMLEQSQLEVNKLAQRNLSVTAHLQQVQAQFDSLPRPDIRTSYESALDAQQRLFVMRGQMEKLQTDQTQFNRQAVLIERMLKVMETGNLEEDRSRSSSATAEMLEMVIQAQESERQRLSRQMHDGPAQALSNFILQTEIAMRLFDVDQSKAREELANMKISATSSFKQVRDFIFELRPMSLDDLGLPPTLKRYSDAFKEQTGVDARLTLSGMEKRIESYQEVMIFRAIQELMNNVGRHSEASVVKVQVEMRDSNVRVTVDDNGKGFDLGSLPERGGMGLKVIRERVEMLGGFLEITSVIDHGTRVTFQIPAVTVSAMI